MPRIHLPANASSTCVRDIFVRISTPAEADAAEIDARLESIFFLHPIWTDGYFFHPQFEDHILSSRFNLIAIDARGHGQTMCDHLEPGYDGRMAARDVYETLLKLGIDQPHIVAASTGCITAIRYAAEHPCASLTCIGLPSPVESEDNKAGFEEIKALHASAMHSGHKDDLRELVEAIMTFGVDGQQIPAVRQLCEAYERAALEDSLDNDEQIDCHLHHVFDPVVNRKPLTEADIAMIKCPVLLIHGEDDQIYRPHFSHDFQLALLDSRPSPSAKIPPHPVQLAIVPHQPHWTSVTAPERVNPILDSFLLRVARHQALARDEEDMALLEREMFKSVSIEA